MKIIAVSISHKEWEVPDLVRRIRIKMANDEEFVIESQGGAL